MQGLFELNDRVKTKLALLGYLRERGIRFSQVLTEEMREDQGRASFLCAQERRLADG